VRDVLGVLFGFVLGTISGLLTPVIQRHLRKTRGRIRDRRYFNPLRFDPQTVNFFTLNQWSEARPLHRSLIIQAIGNPQPQTWCDEKELTRIRNEITDKGGPACSLIDLVVDHRESDEGQSLRLTFAPSVYGDFLAVSEYFTQHPDEVSVVMDRLEREGTESMIRTAPLSVVAVNVTVTSSDGYVLAIRRSSSVRTSQNVWTLGPNETMNLPNGRPGESEDFYRLAERCLREELGLEPLTDYEQIFFSWMGYNVPGAIVHIIAHVMSTRDHFQIEESLHRSHGAFEADQIAWIKDRRKDLEQIVRHHHKDEFGRRWIESAPLAAQQYWRVRGAILR